MSVLDGWDLSEFTAAGYTREVYRRGSGPGVIVVHEIPGITPKVTAFANEVVAAGFTVLMPVLVGTRFDSLRELLGDSFIAVELPSSSKRDHSVLTEHRDEPSVQRVLQFFKDKLLA